MRIISGHLKGRRLPIFKNMGTRPTTDFAREALFNLIEHKKDIDECTFLDLFSGTGSISFEFISRGAKSGMCIDMSKNSQVYRKKCMKEFGIENLTSIRKDVFSYLKKAKDKYDIIFADPPYQLKEIPLLPNLVYDNHLLNENGLLVIEHPKEVAFGKHPNFVETRNYSTVHFSFFM